MVRALTLCVFLCVMAGSGVADATGVDVAATDSLATFLQEAKTKISTSATTMEITFFMARFLSRQPVVSGANGETLFL